MKSEEEGLTDRFGWDTIQAFEDAYKQRIEEADFFHDHRFFLVAIYLYGYAVEMILKISCYVFAEFGREDRIRRADRIRVEGMAGSYQVPKIFQHDIAGWSRLAVAFKNSGEKAADTAFLRLIQSNAQSIAEHWHPILRYRATIVTQDQADAIRKSTEWFALHYEEIIKK